MIERRLLKRYTISLNDMASLKEPLDSWPFAAVIAPGSECSLPHPPLAAFSLRSRCPSTPELVSYKHAG